MGHINYENAADMLREQLRNGIVSFAFMKKDGTRRAAHGTTNLDLIPQDLWPKILTSDEESTARQKAIGSVTFFDTDSNVWRSCKEDSIVEVEGEEVSDEQ